MWLLLWIISEWLMHKRRHIQVHISPVYPQYRAHATYKGFAKIADWPWCEQNPRSRNEDCHVDDAPRHRCSWTPQ